MLNAIIVSKISGMCLAINQMIELRESTNISGGNEFVERYIGTQSETFGVSARELGEKCEVAHGRYRAAYKLLSGSNKESLKF